MQRLLIVGLGLRMLSNFACNLKLKCFFPCDIKDLRCMCDAIMIKTALCNFGDWENVHKKLHAPRGHDDDLLVHCRQDWQKHAVLSKFREVHEMFDVPTFLSSVPSTSPEDFWLRPDFQKNAYYFLLSRNAPFCLESALQYRFRKCGWFAEDDSGHFARTTCVFLENIRSRVPPCVMLVVLQTFFNGWATSARFQKLHEVCLLCSRCDEVGAIEHHACCTFLWKAFGKLIFLAVCPDS